MNEGAEVAGRHHAQSSTALVRRVTQVVLGTAAMGGGTALLVRAGWGLIPMDVLHTGVAGHLGWTVGAAIIATQATLLALWFPLRIRPGLGTACGVIVPGFACNGVLAVVHPISDTVGRIGLWVAGAGAFALGVALYLVADLGANPRDGLGLWVSRRTGASFAWIRIGLDVVTLAAGLAVAGSGSVTTVAGSIVLAAVTGPAVATFMRVLAFTPVYVAPHIRHPARRDVGEPTLGDPGCEQRRSDGQ